MYKIKNKIALPRQNATAIELWKKKIIMGNFGKRPQMLKGLGTLP